MGKRRARLDCSFKPPQPQLTHTYTHVCLCVANRLAECCRFGEGVHLDLGVWRSQLTTPAVRARAVFLWLLFLLDEGRAIRTSTHSSRETAPAPRHRTCETLSFPTPHLPRALVLAIPHRHLIGRSPSLSSRLTLSLLPSFLLFSPSSSPTTTPPTTTAHSHRQQARPTLCDARNSTHRSESGGPLLPSFPSPQPPNDHVPFHGATDLRAKEIHAGGS